MICVVVLPSCGDGVSGLLFVVKVVGEIYTGEEIKFILSFSPLCCLCFVILFVIILLSGRIHRRGDVDYNSRSPLCLLSSHM